MQLAQQVRRPLIGTALSVAIGIGIEQAFLISPLLLLGISALLLARMCRKPTTLLFYVVCGLLAATNGELALRQSVRSCLLTTGRDQSLAGVVISDPVQRTDQVSFRLRTVAVDVGETWVTDRTVVQVYLRHPPQSLTYGQYIILSGRYTKYEKPRDGANGVLSLSGRGVIQLADAKQSLIGLCYDLRRRVANLFDRGTNASSEQTKLLLALLLGYRQLIPDHLYQTFAYTGALHIFAISGLHVGVMAAILIALLKTTGVSRERWGLFLIPTLLLYVISTGMKSSALRAFTMATIYFSAPLIGRKPDSPSSIALAAILLLAVRPLRICDPGFLLSFTVVSGIIMVHGYVSRQRNRLRRDGWALPFIKFKAPHFIMTFLQSTDLLMRTSLAAWIFSIPLTALFFNTFSPVALIGNMAIIPLTFMIVLTGTLTLLIGPFSSPVILLFNDANRVFIDTLILIIQWTSRLPGAWWFIRSPTNWVLLLWYSGLILFLAGPSRLRRFAGVLLLLALLFWARGNLPSTQHLEMIARTKSTVILKIPRNQWILLSDGNPFYTKQTIRLLQKEGVNRLHAFVVSDASANPETLRQLKHIFRPQQTWMSGQKAFTSWPVGTGTVSFGGL